MRGTDFGFEQYHTHLGYSLLVTLLVWPMVAWFGHRRLRARPAQRAVLFGLAVAYPLCAEAGSFLITLLRPELDTLSGQGIAQLHAAVLRWVPIDDLLDLAPAPAVSQVAIGVLVLFCLASIAHCLHSARRLRRAFGRSLPLDATRHAALFERFRALAGANGRPLPPVLVVDLAAPLACTTGLTRPRIYIASLLLDLLSPEECVAVLCHEWAHVVRRDLLWSWLVRLFRDIFCFLPGSYPLWRAMLASQDEACDALAARMTRQPLALARAVVKVAHAWEHHRLQTPVAANLFALPSASPRARVTHMLRLHEQGHSAGSADVYLLVCAISLLAVLPVLLGC